MFSTRRRKIYYNCGTKRSRQQQRWTVFFRNHAEAQPDLSVAIDGKLNTVLMPGLNCSPNSPIWTNFAKFWLFFNRQALGYFGLVLRYRLGCKLEENLAALIPSIILHLATTVLRVPRFSCGIVPVLIRSCGKNLAVAGCSFWAAFCHPVPLFQASFWSKNKCKRLRQLCVIWRLLQLPAYFRKKYSSKTGSTGSTSHYRNVFQKPG